MFSINSGIDGLNEMLNGGIPEKSITALVGPTGSGKTILSLQFLYANLSEGRNCIYMSAAHTTEELVINALNYGWDLSPYLENKRLVIEYLTVCGANVRSTDKIHYIDMLTNTLGLEQNHINTSYCSHLMIFT